MLTSKRAEQTKAAISEWMPWQQLREIHKKKQKAPPSPSPNRKRGTRIHDKVFTKPKTNKHSHTAIWPGKYSLHGSCII